MKVFGLLATLFLLHGCHGYSLGPPLSACGNMFPEGHGVPAQTSDSPFSFQLNATTYRPGDVIEVFLNSSGDWFMEGVLVQMRFVETCVGDKPAVGTFDVEQGEDFIQRFNCFGKTASALRHFSHQHIYNRTFYWTAPSEAVGHVYIRATIARNQETFWMGVRSEIIFDASNSTRTGIVIRDHTCGADRSVYTLLFLAVNLVIAYFVNNRF